MKRKSPARLKSKLWKKLQPEVDLTTLTQKICEFLEKPVSKSGGDQSFANNLAVHLTQNYLFLDRKSLELRRLIERHPDDLAAVLDQTEFKEFQAFAKISTEIPEPASLKEWAELILKTPDKSLPTENDALSANSESPRRKKKRRARPKTESERTRRRKEAKNKFEERRRYYRRGLIVQEFGSYPFPTLCPDERTPPEGLCLDVLFTGGTVSMAAHCGSLEDLFEISRRRLSKAVSGKRYGRNSVYDLAAFVKCLTYLLDNRDGKEQWLPEGVQRNLVLTGIIHRAHQQSPKAGRMLAKELRPYLP